MAFFLFGPVTRRIIFFDFRMLAMPRVSPYVGLVFILLAMGFFKDDSLKLAIWQSGNKVLEGSLKPKCPFFPKPDTDIYWAVFLNFVFHTITFLFCVCRTTIE